MRKWIYIGKLLPNDQEDCYARLAGNEYYPIEVIFDLPTLSFKDASETIYIPAEKFIKWTSKFI